MKLLLQLLLTLVGVLAGGGAAAGEWIAVVVAPSRAVTAMERADLALIYERRRLYWSDGRKIQPLNLPAGDPARVAFSAAVMDLKPSQIDDYWNGLYFHGIRPPFVVGSTEAVLRFVAATPDAIGYVSLCAADARVHVLMRIAPDGGFSDHAPPEVCASRQ